MTPQQKLEKFVQDVNRTAFGSALTSLTDEDGLATIANTKAFLDMYLDELEMETDENGEPIDWDWTRNYDATLGTIVSASQVLTLGLGVRKLVVDEDRPITLAFGGIVISHFDVVDADQITKREGMTSEDRVTKVRNNLIFSRLFKTSELGATVIGDTISSLPRLADDVTYAVLDQVKPYQLLVLGVAKNLTLPDIIQGGLSPSFVQKYNDLLMNSKAENRSTTVGDMMVYEDFSGIGSLN